MLNRTLLILLALAVAIGCATWKSYTPEQKLNVIAQGLEIVVKPECVRAAKLNDEDGVDYVALCESLFDDVIAGIRAGVLKDPAEVCPRIAGKIVYCTEIPGQYNVATCERLVRASDLACKILTDDPSAIGASEQAASAFASEPERS